MSFTFLGGGSLEMDLETQEFCGNKGFSVQNLRIWLDWEVPAPWTFVLASWLIWAGGGGVEKECILCCFCGILWRALCHTSQCTHCCRKKDRGNQLVEAVGAAQARGPGDIERPSSLAICLWKSQVSPTKNRRENEISVNKFPSDWVIP